MTKKCMEKANRERNAKVWFEKRGCTRSNKMERRCPTVQTIVMRNVRPPSVNGDITGLKLESSSIVVEFKFCKWIGVSEQNTVFYLVACRTSKLKLKKAYYLSNGRLRRDQVDDAIRKINFCAISSLNLEKFVFFEY